MPRASIRRRVQLGAKIHAASQKPNVFWDVTTPCMSDLECDLHHVPKETRMSVPPFGLSNINYLLNPVPQTLDVTNSEVEDDLTIGGQESTSEMFACLENEVDAVKQLAPDDIQNELIDACSETKTSGRGLNAEEASFGEESIRMGEEPKQDLAERIPPQTCKNGAGSLPDEPTKGADRVGLSLTVQQDGSVTVTVVMPAEVNGGEIENKPKQAAGEVAPKIEVFKKNVPPPPPSKKKLKAGNGNVPPAPTSLTRNRAGNGLTHHPEVIQMFHEMRRALQGNIPRTKIDARRSDKSLNTSTPDSASIFAEICKNSPYSQRIQADIVEYKLMIENLIRDLAAFKPSTMSAMIDFVNSTDSILDQLSDEPVVLKAFNWPKKYNIMREAKALSEELEGIRLRFLHWQRNAARSLKDELAEMEKYTMKTIKRHDAIMRTDAADTKRFKEAGIPWDGRATKEAKRASANLLQVYMDLTLEEVEQIKGQAMNDERKEKLCLARLTGAIRFCFKVHQFAGGLSEACSVRFAAISEKAREHLRGARTGESFE